jgi:hypothetical protein
MFRLLAIPFLAAALCGQPAENAYKNIQVLQGLSQGQLMPAMRFMSAALGVSCAHCHAVPSMERDDKPAKVAARRMIELTRRINKDHFGGKDVVNCNTCHNGQPAPATIPGLERRGETVLVSKEPLPAVQQVLARYLEAAGGNEAISKVATRIEKGYIEMRGGRRAPMERFHKAPDKLLMVGRLDPKTETLVGYDGKEGWEAVPAQNRFRGADTDTVARLRIDAAFPFELRVTSLWGELTVTGREKVGDREAVVLSAGETRLYFDTATGLLVRIRQVEPSALGPIPSIADFDDYRPVDGVKVAHVVRWIRSDAELTFRFDEVRHNEAIEDEKFQRRK